MKFIILLFISVIFIYFVIKKRLCAFAKQDHMKFQYFLFYSRLTNGFPQSKWDERVTYSFIFCSSVYFIYFFNPPCQGIFIQSSNQISSIFNKQYCFFSLVFKYFNKIIRTWQYFFFNLSFTSFTYFSMFWPLVLLLNTTTFLKKTKKNNLKKLSPLLKRDLNS